MKQQAQQSRRGPSLETLIFKMGGFNGAVRRIISRWERPFTANQVKVALVRRYPELIPADHQVEDILEWFVFSKQLARSADGSYRHAPLRPEFQSATVLKSPNQKPQLIFTFK